MTLDNLITRVRSQMSRGQIVLFTGAGFSLGATNRAGERLPTAAALRDLLLNIAYPGEPPDGGTTLNDAFAVALRRNRGDVRRLFENRLSVSPDTLPDFYRLYFSLPWYRVYTLNIDDLESAAAHRFNLARAPLTISATTLAAEEPRRPGASHLEVVHLNGALSDPPDALTFSDAQYAGRAVSPDSWYTRCVIDLRSRPVIYVGTELNESTLWHHVELRRRQGVESDILPPGSVLVTPSLSRARSDTLKVLNVDWVEATAEEFVAEVLGQLGDAADRGLSFLKAYDESFGRAGIPLVSELIVDRAATATEYLMGEEPQWSDIIQGRAAVRTNDAALLASARDILEGRAPKTALAVTGTAATGKSTALMRLALELSNQGLPVLWVDRDSSAPPALIRKRVSEFGDERVVLAMDDADTFGAHIVRLIRDLVPSKPNLLIVVAMRSPRFDEANESLSRVADVQLREHMVPNLTDDDVDALIATLDRHNRLGILKGADAEARRRAFRDKCGRQLLVAMIEATSGERFDDKIADELDQLPGVQKFIYAVICIAGREKHYLTRDEILLACQALPGDPVESLTLLVRRHIVVAPPPGQQHRPRHRVVADIVCERLQRQGQLAEALKALVQGLAFKVVPGAGKGDRVWRLLVRLMNHDFLLNNLDLHHARELYQRIEEPLAADYHYWLQRGSLEVEYGDLRRAELFLNQAHSLATDDYKVDTELGYLLMKKGIENPSDGRATGWVDEGIQLLEGVIALRGDDYYPYHVLGSQGLAWARRATSTDEKRRLLNYFSNVVQQGVEKHRRRRDLEQLAKDIQRDLLMMAVPGSKK